MENKTASYHIKKKKPVINQGNLSAKLFSVFAYLQLKLIMLTQLYDVTFFINYRLPFFKKNNNDDKF